MISVVRNTRHNQARQWRTSTRQMPMHCGIWALLYVSLQHRRGQTAWSHQHWRSHRLSRHDTLCNGDHIGCQGRGNRRLRRRSTMFDREDVQQVRTQGYNNTCLSRQCKGLSQFIWVIAKKNMKTQQWRALPSSSCTMKGAKRIKLMCNSSHVDLMQNLFAISQEARLRPHCAHCVYCVNKLSHHYPGDHL